MSSEARSRCSISKQRGAAMSSRLMPPKPGRDRLDRRHDPVGVGGVEADRPGVDAAELLEELGLALHHRHRRGRPDVAEPEHGAAVGDDRDRVALDRQVPDLLGILGDRAADARHARRVGHREVIARPDRDLGLHRDLAAEVQQEGAVGDLLDLDAVDPLAGSHDRLRLLVIGREHADVARLAARVHAHEVDRPEQPAGIGDRAREGREAAGAVVEANAEGEAERCRVVRHGSSCRSSAPALN